MEKVAHVLAVAEDEEGGEVAVVVPDVEVLPVAEGAEVPKGELRLLEDRRRAVFGVIWDDSEGTLYGKEQQ